MLPKLIYNKNKLFVEQKCIFEHYREGKNKNKIFKNDIIFVIKNCGCLPSQSCLLVSISPTFYEQFLRQNPFAKKLQTQIVST
jgi:hypothetical protein